MYFIYYFLEKSKQNFDFVNTGNTGFKHLTAAMTKTDPKFQ